MSRPSLTLSCIAKNEEENVKRLIDSVQGCVDEVIITDTGSTDKTVEVVKKCGASVRHFNWIDDFSAARNHAFSDISTDYVMWLDLDDVLENQAGFKLFRDDVMRLADYWIATYHYSSDASGKPTCSFARERVFKVSKHMNWKYPIHEGVIPVSPAGNVNVQFTSAWSVRHMRTDADLQKDRSRNLKIFEKIKNDRTSNQMDARMWYYYGKELFEAGKPMDSILALSKALEDERLELHDRILGMQYACYAYIQLGQNEKSLQLAHQGTILAPHRAEFYGIIGDCYIKMGRPQDAIPAFSAAKSSQIQVPKGFAAAIFHSEDAYTAYPRNQLARIYANIGDLDRSEAEAKECFDRFQNAEGKAILDEVKRIKIVSSSFKNATPCDDIVISCPPVSAYEFDPGIAAKKAMGGSETALIEMAYHLNKLSGRKVKVFNMRTEDKSFGGVEYIAAGKAANYFAENKPFLHIAWRHNFKVTDAPTFVWSHDLQTQGIENTENFDKVMCLTPFHQRYMAATQGIPIDKIYVTRNGLKPERFSGGPWKKDPFKFVFSSSPDRGLDRTMRVLDKVREVYPQIKLHVAYGIEHLPKWGHQALHDLLKAMMEERKEWVIYEGAMQQDALMDLFKSSAYCVQPSDFVETSMISAMERACCGIYQIMRKVGGVVDTLAEAESLGMATLIDSDCITETEYQKFIDATLSAIETKAYSHVKMDAEKLSWESVAREWLEELPKLSEKVNGSAA